MNLIPHSPTSKRIEFICIAFLITCASHAFPRWASLYTWSNESEILSKLGRANFYYFWQLLFAGILVCSAPKRNGLCIGEIGKYKWRTLAVCTLPIILTLCVYPFLEVKPFSGRSVSLWLVSPFTQDLIFSGFLFAHFREHFPGDIHPKIPVNRAIIIVAVFFAAWHLPNFKGMPVDFVCFQLLYTFFGSMWIGLTRQWTGSILYITATHMSVNFIAWYF